MQFKNTLSWELYGGTAALQKLVWGPQMSTFDNIDTFGSRLSAIGKK